METMNTEHILNLFSGITVWKRGDQRAPHKPLLLLMMLARLQQGKERLAAFEEIQVPLTKLLIEFGPARKSNHPEMPFWYLQYDELWHFKADSPFRKRPHNRQPSPRELKDANAHAGFLPEIHERFHQHPSDISAAANELLYAHFPATLHEDIAESVGLNLFTEREKQQVNRFMRDPAFRPAVMDAYGGRCAVCSWDLRLGENVIGLEAAHIKWVQYNGPDIIPNGLALCSLHHKLLDKGAITITPEYRLLVSDRARGKHSLEEQLLPYHNMEIALPAEKSQYPEPAFLVWHGKEVFHQK